jgi:hypothetical protein
MKKTHLLAILTTLMISSHVFADEGKKAHQKDHPCKKVEEACLAAGFKRGGHKDANKGLWKDCMGKIKAGESVPGVNVEPAVLEACKNKAQAHKAKKRAEKQEEIKETELK